MLTAFGKAMRKLRIDRNILLKTMADDLGVTSSYLSGIEHGKKPIPSGLIERIQNLYDLNDEEVRELTEGKEMTVQSINIPLMDSTKSQIRLANAFARKLDDFSEDDIKRIFKAINGE